MMDAIDVEKMKTLLIESVSTLCNTGLNYLSSLKVEGLLAVTVDSRNVMVVNINKEYNKNVEDSGINSPVTSPSVVKIECINKKELLSEKKEQDTTRNNSDAVDCTGDGNESMTTMLTKLDLDDSSSNKTASTPIAASAGNLGATPLEVSPELTTSSVGSPPISSGASSSLINSSCAPTVGLSVTCTPVLASSTSDDAALSSVASIVSDPSPAKKSAMAGADPMSWHQGKDLREKLEAFHQNKARFPKEGLDHATSLEQTTLLQLRDQMKTMDEFKVKRFEYTGSIYEKLKIQNPDEFDIMVIIDTPDLKETPVRPGFYKLTPKDSAAKYSKMMVGNEVSSVKALDLFFGFLVKAVKARGLDGVVLPRRHGPAVQIDVEERGIKFSIDVVPTFQLAEDKLYVAKAPKTGNHNAWRKSTSLEEKRKMKTIDSGSGVRRQCVRILKAIAEKEAGFKLLYSYHFKTALLHLNDRKDLQWRPQDLGPRVMDLLELIQKFLEKGHFPHYYIREMNLVEGKSQGSCTQLANRIQRLRKNEQEFLKLIKV